MTDTTHPGTSVLEGECRDERDDGERRPISPRHMDVWQRCCMDVLKVIVQYPILKLVAARLSSPLPLPLFEARPTSGWTTAASQGSQSQSTSRDILTRRHVSGRTDNERQTNFDLTDMREVRHKKRVQKLLDLLDPVLSSEDSDESVVFLCWGKEERCRIIPVRVADQTDEADLLLKLRKAWYSHRGPWREWLRPLFDIDKVEIVKIAIAGRHPTPKIGSRNSSEFVGTYVKKDYAAKIQRLKHSIAQCKYGAQDPPCKYNLSTGETDCLNSCISHIVLDPATSPSLRCPEKTLHEDKRKRQRVKTGPAFLRLAFHHPEFAAESRYIHDERIIYNHLEILRAVQAWNRPQPSELNFRALHISERWRLDSRPIAVPATVTAFSLMVVGARLIYGDWATAWNVGCFWVGLAALLCMWTDHAAAT